MTKRHISLATLTLLLIATSVPARTWRVEKDGTGDFAILYEAADACAAGDTILIGPGRFEEYRREPEYQWNAYCCMHITVPSVTVIGSGRNATFVGFEHFDHSYPDYVIGLSCGTYDLTVKNLTVGGVHDGIHFEGPNLLVEDCSVVETDCGVATWSSSSSTFHECQFISSDHHGVVAFRANGVVIEECEFIKAESYALAGAGGSGWVVRDTEIHDCIGGIHFEQGAQGVVERCRVQVAGGNPPAIGILTGSVISLYENEFIGDFAASFLTNGTVVTARNNIFQGGNYTAIKIGLTPMDFHGNHILNGGGMSVLALWERGNLNQPYDLDLSGNYWGTTDSTQIAAWIDDYTDHPPMDNYHYVIVGFEPFEDQPVQTEQTTWGAMKSLFK